MLVRAIEVGFHKGIRIYPGEVFDYPEKLVKKAKDGKQVEVQLIKRDKDGNIVKPAWVEDAPKPSSVTEKKEESKPVSVKEAGKSVI